ncbi:MAG: hypothetical protein R2712_08045 [Vicinamibacterales bacterium]
MQERHGQRRPQREWACSEQPEHEHPEERLRVAALRLHQVRGGHERREREWRRGEGGHPGIQPRLRHQQAPQENGRGCIDQHHGEPQREHGGPRDGEHRRHQPRFHAEHVLLAVEEERKRPALREVLGHQADDGLVGIEVAFVEGEEEPAAHGDRGEQDRDDEQRARLLIARNLRHDAGRR